MGTDQFNVTVTEAWVGKQDEPVEPVVINVPVATVVVEQQAGTHEVSDVAA